MEPDVIRMYSSSPPPMEDGTEEEEDEFGDFGGFSSGGVPNSISFTEFDTPTSFNQSQALAATSPPELLNNGGVVVGRPGLASSANGTRDLPKVNGVVPGGVCQTDGPSERTVGGNETKKVLSNATDLSGSGQVDCNGTGAEVLTNGFATLEVQGESPPSQKFVRSHKKGNSSEEDVGTLPPGSPEEDNFADFAAFPGGAEGHHHVQAADTSGNLNNPRLEEEEDGCQEEHSNIEQGMTLEDDVRDTNRTGSIASGSDSISFSVEAPDDPSNGDRGSHTDADSKQRDIAFAHEHATSEAVCTKEPVALNGVDNGDDFQEEAATCGGENGLSPETAEDSEGGQLDGKGSGNETETETETSFGRPLSTDALEEYGDMSTTGSVPSPPLPEDTATPADHSQLGEDDDEDFGDFGDAASFGSQGFADFDQPEPREEKNDRVNTPEPPAEEEMAGEEVDDDFGDFDAPKFHSEGPEDGSTFADFPCSESFGNFTTAAPDGVEDSGADAGWSAFDEPEPSEGGEQEESWAAFGEEQSAAAPLGNKEEEWQESVTATPAFNKQTSRRDSHSALLSGRLERLFQSSFPETPVLHVGDDVTSLKALLEPSGGSSHPGHREEEPCSGALQDVWRQLLDIHGAFGLRHQWGGSHSNKTLLCSLGIDIRNILFTGQKKHPVIVPMYAASLGMLEPTKEPVKPISAAEMIASIAQTPPVGPAKSSCPPDTAQQETLPPVQFDWSSSGLTNPLDASGGSSLLNLDFFGPVEDSGSTSTPSIPGVDPELYELTTAKLDPSGSSSRVADAFARLMSTMEKTSTSTRKPRKEENLSHEASKVIAGLPDLSFMQAKVLMFPTTLTPLGCTEPTPD